MPLQSNAAPNELNSPFYLANKELCEHWEQFILERNGNIDAIYNAWSFAIRAKVKTNYNWSIFVKKATYSNGFLLFSSKRQNLQQLLELKTRPDNTDCPDFCITTARFKSKSVNHPMYKQVLRLWTGKEYDKIELNKGVLTFTFQDAIGDFDLVNSVLAFIES